MGKKIVNVIREKGLLDPTKAINSEETYRGFLASIFGGGIINLLGFFCRSTLKWDISKIALIINTILGNLLAYSSDILFAKKKFRLYKYKGKNYDYTDPEIELAYNEYGTRFIWLLKSF